MTITTTGPTTTPPAPQWLHDLNAARVNYEENLGWPVTVDVAQRRLAVAVDHLLGVITMPESLGQSVLAELRIMMLAGPVVADHEGPLWTFLADLGAAPLPVLPAELRARGVHRASRGEHVTIPGLSGDEGSSWWVQPPRPRRRLPPWSVVIGTTRRVVNGYPGTADTH